VAREVRALLGGELRVPETQRAEDGPPAAEAISVAIDAEEACHHYVARVVRGVRVGPSPEWLVRRLEASGLRAINVVVDVTNYVLLEFGQPLHAFDLATLRGPEIRVRFARPGEKLATLDGQTRELAAEDLVIADAERPIAIAGVMGGAETEVGPPTTEVLIESAHFHPTRVRLSARRHGLQSEASYRFERGVDREGVRRAADRCACLLAELAGGKLAAGSVEARGAPPHITEEIRFESERANRLLGTSLSSAEMAELLERVDVSCHEVEPGVLLARIPSHRNDLEIQQDLTEEVARVYGYDRIPTTEPVGLLRPVERPRGQWLAEQTRDALAGAGLLETVSFPFVAAAEIEGLRLAPDDERRATIGILNPIKEEEPRLRSSLVPSLLRLARENLRRQVERVRIFEVSCVFRPVGEGELPREPLHAAALLAETAEPRFWEAERPRLFFEAKGVAERLLSLLGYVAVLQREGIPPYLHPGAAAVIAVGGQVIGAVGELHPEVTVHFEIEVPCAILEVDLGALEKLRPSEVRYRDVSRFPQIRRDLAVVVDRDRPAGELLEAVRQTAGKDCVLVELFDRYEGPGVPEGRVSLAFRLVFERTDRNLTHVEVTPAIERVVRMLAHRFGGELR